MYAFHLCSTIINILLHLVCPSICTLFLGEGGKKPCFYPVFPIIWNRITSHPVFKPRTWRSSLIPLPHTTRFITFLHLKYILNSVTTYCSQLQANITSAKSLWLAPSCFPPCSALAVPQQAILHTATSGEFLPQVNQGAIPFLYVLLSSQLQWLK